MACQISNCISPFRGRKLCDKHWKQLRKYGAVQPDLTITEKFWLRVKKSNPEDCWEWQGSITSAGYGGIRIKFDGKTWNYAHRFSFYLSFGVDPAKLCVCHKCDNPKCVNPSHLFLGTIAENSADMTSKNRHLGERSGFTKLNEEMVYEIKKMLRAGESQARIAAKFGVHKTSITKINTKKIWVRV